MKPEYPNRIQVRHAKKKDKPEGVVTYHQVRYRFTVDPELGRMIRIDAGRQSGLSKREKRTFETAFAGKKELTYHRVPVGTARVVFAAVSRKHPGYRMAFDLPKSRIRHVQSKKKK